jgi:hypothetical protein
MSNLDSVNLPLRDIKVAVEDLYLWPDNPRLRAITDLDGASASIEDITSDRMQAKLLAEMSQPEFETDELMDSIRARGFVPVDSIFVKRMDGAGKFLVLEGNRRATALKRLLNRSADLPVGIEEAIRIIPAKELECEDLESARDDIDFILGIRHHGGIKIWGPIQRAHNLYKRYLREAQTTPAEFAYDVAIAKSVGATFTVGTRAVRNSLRVYRVFEQLRKNEYAVRDNHFSLIDSAVSNRSLGEYFEQDQESFRLSGQGMERFDRLCLIQNCSITSPQQFAKFAKIREKGTAREVALVEAGGEDVDEMLRRIQQRHLSRRFYERLVELREEIEGLPLTEYQGTAQETGEIKRISHLVQNRLGKLR